MEQRLCSFPLLVSTKPDNYKAKQLQVPTNCKCHQHTTGVQQDRVSMHLTVWIVQKFTWHFVVCATCRLHRP